MIGRYPQACAHAQRAQGARAQRVRACARARARTEVSLALACPALLEWYGSGDLTIKFNNQSLNLNMKFKSVVFV